MKAQNLRNSILSESAPGDATTARYEQIEPRLRGKFVLGKQTRIRHVIEDAAASKSLQLAIDASSGANAFKTEKLRLSAFQNAIFY